MANEINIKFNELRKNIENVRSVLSNLKPGTETEFDQTNIEVFVQDLEMTKQSITMIHQYQTLLNSDLDTLVHVGERMQATDKQLANEMGVETNGP
ncbi:TIGR04197 family type VII secretion effector [Virgibacillus dakarensis]|uniref:Uncharacterized protein n=1 Tax=Lentibacillus populi TaxID=1827502 RepID=A0A9W5TZ89_9BACI|nr:MULTISPECIES: TIGR04197 family type VII secretion effector [Bacillaceae]MBT2217431.1 TIGR04197 family type VII secretion effector [Virgibacillus dakarensis]MTW86265.1 TIGR04197 family type VII secretion effector [Virgibacillus dakarensis]GGB50278.1 hypothetical protein GCM10011409_29860 [Lentibacillus populi]